MTIPAIRDICDGTQANKVRSQCQDCARLLATHLYVWRKSFPARPTLKSWSADGLCFVGMDIDLFACYLMQHFTLKTADGKEWLLDRSIAALISAACTDADSPLPEASWQVEIDLNRKAVR